MAPGHLRDPMDRIGIRDRNQRNPAQDRQNANPGSKRNAIAITRTFVMKRFLIAGALAFPALLWMGSIGATDPPPQPGNPVAWVWSGAITPHSAVVKAKTGRGASKVRLLISTDPRFSTFRPIPGDGFADPDVDGVAAFELRDLKPDTPYFYCVEVKGKKELTGSFRTFSDGPMSFKVAFASCATTGSNHRIFSRIRQLQPNFFLHMGDFHYEDIHVNDPELFRRTYDLVLASDRQSDLYRHVPIAYVWDDHDFGPNDSDRTAPGRPAAWKTYRQCVPHYPLVGDKGATGAIHQAFTVGRVRFLMTDVRSERSPASDPDGPNKTMLGDQQLLWLEAELSLSRDRYPLIVWVNTVPWITASAPGSIHGWEPYSRERARIADRIKALGLVNRLVMLSGDAHMVAIDDGTNSNYASSRKPGEHAFPVVQAAPLDRYPRVKGGPYSHGVHAKSMLFGLLKIQQFGLMQVRDDGKALEVELTGHDAEGRLLDGMLLKLRCDGTGCRILPEN